MPPRHFPVTPDGRYSVHRGRLWRCSDPALAGDERQRLVADLMGARRSQDPDAERDARARVHAAKVALGERGSTWWDGPDLNRTSVAASPYAAWYAETVGADGAA